MHRHAKKEKKAFFLVHFWSCKTVFPSRAVTQERSETKHMLVLVSFLLPKVTKMAQIIAACVECPDRFMVRYEMGIRPTPHATANMRIPI
jgi:hypothetical protein